MTQPAERMRMTQLLLPGEQLLWTGRPDPRVRFGPVDLFLVPFSALWLAFAVFWVVLASRAGFFALFGVPFVVIGLYMFVGRFVVKARQAGRTSYALTDRRALVVTGGSVAELPVAGQAMTTRRSRDGRHVSVTFAAPGVVAPFGATSLAGTGLEALTRGGVGVGFVDVPDVAGLEAALRRVPRA